MAMSVQEIALLKEVARWRRANDVRYFQWRPGVGFGVFTEWKKDVDRKTQINVSYEPDRSGEEELRPRLLVTRDYYGGDEFQVLPVTTIEQAIDVLVALGFLPPRFSSAYLAGWRAGETWAADQMFREPENAGLPVGTPWVRYGR